MKTKLNIYNSLKGLSISKREHVTVGNNSVKVVASYSNAEKDKKRVYRENVNKAGIYCWTNLLDNKLYIGSGLDLTKRFRQYYSLKHIQSRSQKSHSHIYNALIKHGHINFKLDILEYCEGDVLIEREQYYINLLTPEYNILRIAGSRFGAVLSEKTKEQISKALKNSLPSEESKLKMSVAAKERSGVNTSFYGKLHSDKSKLKMSLSNLISVSVFNVETNETLIFKGNVEAAKFLGIGESTLRRYKALQKLYSNKYLILNTQKN